jgi:hypothetical protein
MASAAQRRVRQHYSLERMAPEYAALYARLLDANRKGRP